MCAPSPESRPAAAKHPTRIAILKHTRYLASLIEIGFKQAIGAYTLKVGMSSGE